MRTVPDVAAVIATVFLALPPPSVSAHQHRAAVPAPCVGGERERLGESAVDGGEIRWTESTRYDGPRKHALKAWQFSGATIKLRPDSAATVNDLEFRDYDGGRGERAPVAQYVRDSGTAATDRIKFNRSKMKGRSRAYQNAAAAHELGHALGLCHKADRYLSPMWTNIAMPPVTTPQAVDKANYRRMWK